MAELFVMATRDDSVKSSAGLPPDWQERERALDVRRSWIVEAPAGSGKTGLLIQRYLKLLADESVDQPEQVLAITFTVKATAEMRERVMAHLEAAAGNAAIGAGSEFERTTRELANAVLQRDKMLGWKLLEHPLRLKIRTIDSVCGEIARLLPVLSGGGGRQSPVDDPAPMYREAARNTLMQLGGADAELNAALRIVLLHRDGSLADCERLLMEMLPLRQQWGKLVPLLGREEMNDEFLDREVLPQLQRALDETVCAGLTEFAHAVPTAFLFALAALASSLAKLDPYGREESPVAICSGKVGLPTNDPQDLDHWRALIHLIVTPSNGKWRKSLAKNTLGFEMTKPQKSTLKALLEDVAHRDDLLRAIEKVNQLPPAVYPHEQWVVAKALFRVLSRALAELKLVFARRGQCDFAEWGLLAEVALQEEAGVEDLNTALGMKLQHLLVDEMQDTSTSQYRLIELLTQGWDGHSQTMFLVGDPKQSVYLFRQARVERFVRTLETQQLGDLPLGSLRLTANFRSQRDLVTVFNEDFSLLFSRELNATNPEEVPYVEAQPVRGSSKTKNAAQGTVWHTQTLSANGQFQEKAKAKRRQTKQQARQVREIIEGWRARPLPQGRSEPWKVAVLVRSRNLLPNIVAEFKEEIRGVIPFRAVDIEPLGERQEVLDLLALTRALLHPADRAAWLSVLHAPWCGLGLADLHLLSGADDAAWAERCMEDVVAERGDLLSEEACARLSKTWPILRAAERYRSELTTAQRVERTWRSLGGDTYLKPDELVNARRYLQLLDEIEEQAGALDLRLLQRRVDALYAQQTAVPGAVDLMTIHKAKGLEWDVVIVPGLEKRAPVEREKLLAWNEIDSIGDAAARVMLAPIAGRGEASQELNTWLKCIEKTRAAAERKRLFYVACTRAREELHLFASPEMTSKGEICRAYGSLLSAAWPAAENHFTRITPATVRTKEPAPLENMLVMSLTDEAIEDGEDSLVDLAASTFEQEEARPAMLQQLPATFDPLKRFTDKPRLLYGDDDAAPAVTHIDRPEGSFEARAFGNAVHAFVEVLTRRFARGRTADELLYEVTTWSPRIAASLRGDGLSPLAVGRLVVRVQSGLANMLRDAEGLWLLGAREQGTNEFAMTSWGDTLNSVRMDRVFFGGETPGGPGNDFLWIIDYKTATHGREGIDEFIVAERAKYAPQLQAYAEMMKSRVEVGRIRVALYYVMVPRLIWWAVNEQSDL